MKKIAVFLSFFSAGILILLLSLSSHHINLVSAGEEYDHNGEISGEKTIELSHEEITYLTETFMDILVQDTDISGKVTEVNTIEELLNEFDRIATPEAVMPYLEFYYTEQEDGLYLLPTETPPWFVAENDYKIERMSDSKVKIIQHNSLELYGDYIIEIDFTYTNDWKISNITHR